MRSINALGYTLFFTLPWLAVLAGVLVLLIPRRQEPAAQAQGQIPTPRQAA
jgi:hypothetical protein